MNRFRTIQQLPGVVTVFLIFCTTTSAQQNRFPLQIDILMQPNAVQNVQTLQWAKVFQKISRNPTFRQGKNGERTRVEETQFGGRTRVSAVGIMNRNGSITFLRQTFLATQPAALEAWLNKLEQFGAKGPPHESPSWGLNDDQLKAVLKLLGPAVKTPVNYRNPVAAIESLNLPKDFRVRFTDTADKRRVLSAARMGDLQADCRGLSSGTALAIALSEFGLGFRPMANPDGGYVIEVDVGNESDNMYPVGWKNTAPIFTVIPAIGKSVDVDLDEADLDVVIQLIAQKLEVPHAYSAHQLLIDGKDISTIKYSRKPDRLSIERLMRIVGQAHDIGLSLRTDEAGSVFLWITSKDDFEAFRKRFPDVRPAD